MATLSGAGTIVEDLRDAVTQLNEELTEGDVDFGKLTTLSDRVGQVADGIASTFAQMDRILSEQVLGSDAGQSPGDASGSGKRTSGDESSAGDGAAEDEPTREDLLARAKEVDLPGRSSMSKEELAKALEDAEGMSKEELLEQARKLGIPGRSSMTKDQLREAVQAEERTSKEELLERAREAGVPGRSDMSKDELREALRTT